MITGSGWQGLIAEHAGLLGGEPRKQWEEYSDRPIGPFGTSYFEEDDGAIFRITLFQA